MNTTREQREELRRLRNSADTRTYMDEMHRLLPALLDDSEEAEREVGRLRAGIQHERDRIFSVKSSTSNRLSIDSMQLANGILDRLADLLYG